ncbi:MAG: tRNA (adenosine(37)-N6)-dimethylallyltransferase MiaA [Calditrichaceae bacterium]
MEKIVPFIVGPTGVGKTELSVLLADRLPIEIVSADSRQIYRYMNIGTAKPDADILKRIPHHFIDSLDPDEYYSSGMYSDEARKVIDEIFHRGKLPIVVGGSGFYIKSLVDGICKLDARDEKVRISLRHRIMQEGVEALHEELAAVDPVLARSITQSDRQRIIRGLEVFIVTGKKLSEWHEDNGEAAGFKPRIFGIQMSRQLLYDRINKRVDQMINDGLLIEITRLESMGYGSELNSLNTVGYKEVFQYFQNEITLEEMIDQIKRNTRHYSKRQMTWFKKDDRIVWKEIFDESSVRTIAEELMPVFGSILEHNYGTELERINNNTE